MWFSTRTLSKAEGVPPLWTWPKTVVRVSKPSFFETNCKDGLYEKKKKTPKEPPAWTHIELTLLTSLICSHVIGLPLRSIAPSATMMMFKREPRPLCCTWQVRDSTLGLFRFKLADQHWPTARLLHLGVSCTDAPPNPHLEAFLEWIPSRLHMPEPSPKQGIWCWNESLSQNTNLFFFVSFFFF